MNLPWFRLYSRMVDDEKLRLLAFEDRWHFVAICCLKNEGLLDSNDDPLLQRKISIRLGVQARELDEICRRLMEVGLVDENMNPLAWDELQFRSDTSTDRVKKYREKQQRNKVKRYGNVSVTVQDTDTDTDTEKKENITRAKKSKLNAAPEGVSQEVWIDWKALRQAKKAPISSTALAGIAKQADLAGWTLESALAECVARGWTGFKAEWVSEKENRNGKTKDGFIEALDIARDNINSNQAGIKRIG
jgi:hypothetical protein